MRRLAFAVSAFALFAGSSAFAQVTNVTGDATNNVFVPTTNDRGEFTNDQSPVTIGQPPNARGAEFNSFVNITPSTITFESSNTVEGLSIKTISSSQVAFDFHNPTNSNVVFDSTITPAGFGFYVADVGDGSCLFSGCSQISPLSDITFGSFAAGGNTNIMGQVGFNFDITSTVGNTVTTLYTLSGLLTLNDLGQLAYSINTSGIAGLDTRLTNFTQDANSGSAFGYSWDPTAIHINLGSVADQTITYRTSVFSLSNASCLNQTTCLIAYSGFGDPIGAGGGISNLQAADLSFSLLSFGDGPTLAAEGDGGIDGLGFAPVTFNTPTFQDGRLSFELQAVPEPATWVSMILGFGLLGAAMRRRRVPAHA
jgi:hypothetical protein